ncbi:MAG: aminopeptidase [Clostridia bacterium]|nr:aminopeptidase [Clostridia bacterium]
MSDTIKELSERLTYKKKSVFEKKTESERADMMAFAEDYKAWLDASKTEREATDTMIEILGNAGFKPYALGDKVKAGDKLYYNNRGKNLFAITVGEEPIENGVRICASHIDSPRLDLKQIPLFEKEGIGYFKTHYYGGIRKYQWATIPLALHGVVTKADGTTVKVTIGEDAGDPVLCISDLLPHLAMEQSQKKLSEAFPGESLNIIVCTSPVIDEGEPVTDEGVKLNILSMLNEKYGIIEEDFLSAELTAVPAGKTVDVGLDRWLVGGYGHDDRCCAYTSLRAILKIAEEKNFTHTNIVAFADKEETGSNGVSGMKSAILMDIIASLAQNFGVDASVVRSRSICLSADVAAAYDPNYPEPFEKKNAAILHCGVSVCKFTGSRGKSGTNDTSAEYVGFVRKIFDDANVVWQLSELGKVDAGGGGTVAMYISENNIDTIDIGVPVVSMHSPFELISKADLYEAYEAFAAFCR